jgi:hypothetical protein
MKKINIIKIFVALFVFTFTSCGDVDKEPFDINIEDGPFGSFVRLNVTTSPVFDVTDIAGSSFGGLVVAPSNNVASWTVSVRRFSQGAMSDYSVLTTITSFPSEFITNPTEIAAILGLGLTDLLPGDRFDFEATSLDASGNVVTFEDFGPNLQGGPGQAQAYRFATYISCPFVRADALGTYEVTTSGFGAFPAGNTFELIAGNADGQITMVNPHSSADPDGVGYEVTIDVTPFGIATVNPDANGNKQPIFDTDETGNAGFFDTTASDGVGFVFSCSGAIVLSLDYDLIRIADGGSFTFGSAISFNAQKL